LNTATDTPRVIVQGQTDQFLFQRNSVISRWPEAASMFDRSPR
jgi:hypothetical protein